MSKTLVELEKVSGKGTVVELEEISTKEIDARKPKDSQLEFRARVPDEVLVKIKEKAPTLTYKMLTDPTVSINFGQDVVQKVNDLSVRMLTEQKGVKIPEADAIVNDVLRALDGYTAKYAYKEPGAIAKFFKRAGKKAKETAYDLKAMARDAQPIADRLLKAEGKILKMEYDIDENIARSQQLREVTIESIDDVAAVIAVFEEVLELGSKEVLEAQKTLDKAEKNGDNIVEYREKRYSLEEYREVLADMIASLGEIEKTWFNWRQKFFLYIVNITSAREVINASISMKRTANRVRVDAIPAARTQLAHWQQAALMEETAKTVENANKGMEALIVGASRGSLQAIEAASQVNQQQMLSEKTILELTENLQKSFKTMIDAEVSGREARLKNLELLRKSEEVILNASAEAQRELISKSVAQLSSAEKARVEPDLIEASGLGKIEQGPTTTTTTDSDLEVVKEIEVEEEPSSESITLESLLD